MVIIYSEIKFLDSFKFILLRLITHTPLALAWAISFPQPFVSVPREWTQVVTFHVCYLSSTGFQKTLEEQRNEEPRVWNQDAWVQILLHPLLVG